MEINKEKIIQFSIILLIPFIIDFVGKSYNPSNTKKVQEPKKEIPVVMVEKNKFNITVKINNIKQTEGTMRLALFNNEKDFPSNYDGTIASASEKINNKNNFEYVFKDMSKGNYAIAVFLDKNNNEKLDTGIFGIPLEQYGFSMNPDIQFRAPTFYETDFTLNEDLGLSINLK